MKSHPYAELCPLLQGDDFERLVADVRQNGLLEPIWLYEGRVLDGRNRLRACEAAGVPVQFREYRGDDPVGFVWSMNGERRHLTIGQRAMIAQKMLPMREKEARKRQRDHGGTAPGRRRETLPENFPEVKGDARDQAGATVGVSGKTVDDAKVVRKHSPDLADAVEKGAMSLHAARKEISRRNAGKGANKEPAKADVSRKSRAERIEEISALAAQGYRVSQIAEQIGIGKEQIRNIARDENIKLPDRALGKAHRPQVRRVIETTVHTLSGCALSLDAINGALDGLDENDAREWAKSLGDSLRPITQLRKRLKEYADGRAS